MRLALTLLICPALALAACRRPSSSRPADLLPARIGDFDGGPLFRDDAAARRTYKRGGTRIEVTLAPFPMTDDQYREWVRTSREGYPQAALDIPPEEANGFYQCATDDSQRCDLLIQLRSGFHLEIRRRDGFSSRAEVDAVAHGLPLAALAARAR